MPTTSLMPVPKQQYFGIAGLPLVGGKVYTYAAGTNNPKTTYTDAAGTVPQANPIVLNARGEPASPIYWSGAYKVEVRDALGNLVYTVDNYNTDPAGVWGIMGQVLAKLKEAAGAGLVSFLQTGSDFIRSIQDRFTDSLHARDFGVVGDGKADDYPAFVKACAEAIKRQLPLDIRGLKIYLASQSASIESEGLYLQGSGIFPLPVNWDYMRGTNNQFAVIQDSIIDGNGSAVFSRYNGAIFSGKELAGDRFVVVGDPAMGNSSAYDTGAPTAYPGWSNPFTRLSNFRAYYFGSHGLRCRGGLEVDTIRNIGAIYCNGYCLYVHRTNGFDCPIEYLLIDGCQFEYGLLGNIYLDGVRKSVRITNSTLNDPGQMARRVQQEGFTVATEADIVYPIRIGKDPGSFVAQVITVDECRAEETQGLVSFDGGLFTGVDVRRNFIIPQNNAWPFYHASFKSQLFNLRTEENRSPSGIHFYFTPGMHNGSLGISIGEQATVQTAVQIDGQALAQSQLIPQPARAYTSGTIGDGSAGIFSIDLSAVLPISAVGFDEASKFAVFLVTANFQATMNDSSGAYMMAVTRMSSGNYSAHLFPSDSIAGFTAPPSVSAAGVLSVPLSQYYRGRITRLDSAALT